MKFATEPEAGFEAAAFMTADTEAYFGDFDDPFQEVDFESLGVDPNSPTAAKPGSEEKVKILAARYAAGLPLWHNEDCYDHAPENALWGAEEEAQAQFE